MPAFRWRTDESDDTLPYTHHGYAYALSNPLLYTDPAGTYAIDENGCRTGTIWNEDVKLMIEGNPLSSLVSSSHNTLFISEFISGIDQYGGWLNPKEVLLLLKKLENTTQKLQAKVASGIKIPLGQILTAYNDAYQMLRLTHDQGHSLFLVLD